MKFSAPLSRVALVLSGLSVGVVGVVGGTAVAVAADPIPATGGASPPTRVDVQQVPVPATAEPTEGAAVETVAPTETPPAPAVTGVSTGNRVSVNVLAAGQGSAQGAVPSQIRFRNDVGGGYRLVGAEFQIDGQPIRIAGANADALDSARDLPIYSGQLAPGSHVITSRLQFQGRKRGPFSYVEQYRFNVENTGGFVVPERGRANFTVVTRERRGINVPVDRRLDVMVEKSE